MKYQSLLDRQDNVFSTFIKLKRLRFKNTQAFLPITNPANLLFFLLMVVFLFQPRSKRSRYLPQNNRELERLLVLPFRATAHKGVVFENPLIYVYGFSNNF